MQSEKVKMDQIMKLLFSCNNEMIVPMINYFFETKYEIKDIKIEHSNIEFVDVSLEIIRSDEFLVVKNNDNKDLYHIEFQTKKDEKMLLRMFQYGMAKCHEIFQSERKKITPKFPQQLVIFLEKNESIPKNMEFQFELPNREKVTYSVNVERYWDMEMEDLVKKQLYALVPLQLFNHRRKIAQLCRNKSSTDEIQNEVNKVKETAGNCVEILIQAYEDKAFDVDDLEKVLLVVSYFTRFLYNMYNKKITEEVDKMIKTLWDQTQVENVQVKVTREHILQILKHLNDGECIPENVSRLIEQQDDFSTLTYWFTLTLNSKTIAEFYSKIKEQ
ncbi:hypothetical protein SIM13_26590 [Bacillus cereus group sp. BfR-BA-01233]|uniref:hypothetical protein n=1 Tax=Bacillus cereus group sp. BfR-BA-01233 TaxID=3094879 RepID=UPI000C282B0A|nr:hypothetical protein [Bacillus cereus group sp. BfR-BA-01233]MDX5846550.1 hypothetical protein [Bacillus cereus group sp. BfR-BA-01233]